MIRPLASAVRSETPAGRRAAIQKAWAIVCAHPLTKDELEWAAEVVEESKSKGVDWLAGRLLKMNRETNKCRGR